MTESFVLKLPMGPSANRYWRSLVIKGRLRIVISKEGKQYRETVKRYVRMTGFPSFGKAKMAVRIDFYAPDRRIRDLDNIPKILFDALSKAGVWEDDNQIDDYRVVRRDIKRSGQYILTMQTIEPEDPQKTIDFMEEERCPV